MAAASRIRCKSALTAARSSAQSSLQCHGSFQLLLQSLRSRASARNIRTAPAQSAAVATDRESSSALQGEQHHQATEKAAVAAVAESTAASKSTVAEKAAKAMATAAAEKAAAEMARDLSE